MVSLAERKSTFNGANYPAPKIKAAQGRWLVATVPAAPHHPRPATLGDNSFLLSVC